MSLRSDRPKREKERKWRDVGNAVHLDFKRNRDLLLDLLGGNAGPLGDDLHIVVGDVGIGFHGQLMEGNGSPYEQNHRGGEDDETVFEGEIDEVRNHEDALAVRRELWLIAISGGTMAEGARTRAGKWAQSLSTVFPCRAMRVGNNLLAEGKTGDHFLHLAGGA